MSDEEKLEHVRECLDDTIERLTCLKEEIEQITTKQ